MKQFLSALLLLVLTFSKTFAQSTSNKSVKNGAVEEEKVNMQLIKQQCEGLPIEKRVRVRVSKFTVATSTDTRDNAAKERDANRKLITSIFGKKGSGDDNIKEQTILGDNLTVMLTNALSNVNCYRVLASADDINDLTTEIDRGDSSNKYSNKKTALKKGRQENANIIVKGSVIEYSVKKKGSSILGVSSSKDYIKIGINLIMMNAESGDVIITRDVHAEGQTGKSVSYGFVSSSNSDPNIAGVAEDCIAKGVALMAKLRDSLNLTADGFFAGSSGGNTDTEISLSNINFSSFTAFANLLSAIPSYKSLDKSFSGGTGTYTVTHAGSTDKFLDELTKQIGNKYEVTGVSGDKIELKAK